MALVCVDQSGRSNGTLGMAFEAELGGMSQGGEDGAEA